MRKKKVGELTSDLLARPNLDIKQSLMDTSKEMQKQYLPEIEKCIKTHEKLWSEPFYVVVITKRERLIVNSIRQYFLARQTLPTPDLDQTVFKYTPATGDLKHLWTVPDHGSIDYLIRNRHLVVKAEQQLLEYCMLFRKGKLDEVHGE